MRTAKLFVAAAAAAVILAAVSTSAEAFCHRYRSIPVWYGVYYPNCGPCGGCIMPYVASGAYCGYGYCGIGCGCGDGCGYACAAPCGYAYGCGGGCLRTCHRWAARRSWKRYLRGCGHCFGCRDDCDGSYASCSTGCSSIDTGSGEALYDGPAPADDAPPPVPHDQSARVRRPLILMAGLRTSRAADGSAEFARGLDAFRQGSLNVAAQQFEAAAAAEPDNALYHYHRALTLHDLYGAEAADEARQRAVEAELREPINGWGKRMQRVQGRARVWVEKARREAGLVR